MSTQAQPIETEQQTVQRSRTTCTPAVRNAILARRANGQRITHIANDLSVSRTTVYKVIAETKIDEELANFRPQAIQLIPKAFSALETALDKGDGALGIRYLEDMGVIGENAKNQSTKALENVFSNCQVLIQQATASTLHKNAAEPSTNNTPVIPQVTDTTQDKP